MTKNFYTFHFQTMHPVLVFLSLLVLTILVDAVVWLSWSVNTLYKPAYRRAGLPWKPIALPGLGAWLSIAVGLYFFVLPRTREKKVTRWMMFLCGALFGAVVYGTYDFTTLSIFPHLPLSIILIDILWGSVLCGTVTVMVANLFIKK